jgi:tetratricopeptide (TPR) repeat protein
MVRTPLAQMRGLTVIAEGSTAAAAAAVGDAAPQALAARLHADYLLTGEVTPKGSDLRVATRLIDARSGRALWSASVERPLTDIGAVRDAMVQHVAGTLGLAHAATAGGAVHLEAYRSYTMARQQMQKADPANTGQALELFRRATILDPGFARAYLGLGRALERAADADPGPATATRDESARAFARAAELDPALGEAWSEQARLATEPAQAEALYRKGLGLAPNDGDGYVHYAQFLFAHARVGEAIAAMEQARRIEPLAPELCLTQAFFVMVTRSDVAEHDRLVEQALAINPRLPEALYQLAYSKWEYSGKFAEAAVQIDRAVAARPGWAQARALARDIYLDLGDPSAATAALGPSPPPVATMELAQYRGDRAAAASVVAALTPAEWPDRGPQAAAAQAIRDAAIEDGHPGDAARKLQALHAAHAGSVPMWYRGFDLVYAHALVLAGHREQGLALARSTLALVDAHGLGRTAHWFSRERAAAFAVLGDRDHAISELEHSVANGQLYRWWYLAGHDPLFAPLRGDPRFQSMDRRARRHIEEQRALLRAMRREGASRR